MGKQKPDTVAAVREKLRQVAEESTLTQEEIGVRMGFAKSGARSAVSRLLSPDGKYDPRLSTLLAFAKAVGKPLRDILP